MAENKYLQLEFSTGQLFEYAKNEKDGFEKHVNTKNVTSYRKYYKDGVFGKLKGISVRPSDFGEQLSVFFEAKDGDKFYINLPLMDQKGNIANYATGVIAYMPYLIENEDYRFFPFAIPREDDPTKKNYGVSIKWADLESEDYDNTNLIQKLGQSYFDRKTGNLVEKEIPAGIWSKNFKKEDVLDSTAKNEFLWATLQAHLIGSQEASGSGKGGFNKNAPGTPAAKEQPVVNTVTEAINQAKKPGFDKNAAKTAMQTNAKFDTSKTQESETAEDDDSDDLPF